MREASALARAVLYEGYVLYPYRASSLKNQQPCLLGGLPPAAACAGEARPFFEVACVAEADDPAAARVSVSARFLQLARAGGEGAAGTPPGFHDAEERLVEVAPVSLDALARAPAGEEVAATFSFTRSGGATVEGRLVLGARRGEAGAFVVRARLENATALPPDASAGDVYPRTLAAAHALVEIRGGAFVSSIDPPDALREVVARASSTGVFPVLLGEPGARGAVFASAFALGDHPAVAGESPLDFFDGAEIDEMLALRVRTMTDGEVAEARALDPRTRALVDRVLALDDEELARLHGARRPPALAAPRQRHGLAASGARLEAGDRVVLRPNRRADVFDLALAGELATIASVEQDAEGRVFFTVTVDKDPGRDLGLAGMPGHRFFFRVDEVEPA